MTHSNTSLRFTRDRKVYWGDIHVGTIWEAFIWEHCKRKPKWIYWKAFSAPDRRWQVVPHVLSKPIRAHYIKDIKARLRKGVEGVIDGQATHTCNQQTQSGEVNEQVATH